MTTTATQTDTYKTSDTPKAAYLKSEGHEIKGTELNGARVSFLFDQTETLRDNIKRWETGNARGDIHVFHNAYRYCVKLCKSELLVNS